MRRIAGLTMTSVLALAALSGCAEGDAQDAVDQAQDAVSEATEDVDLPEVDWDKYGDRVRERIDRWAAEADCDKLEGALQGSRFTNNEISDYIEAQIEKAC